MMRSASDVERQRGPIPLHPPSPPPPAASPTPHLGADDAAALPDAGALAQVDRPPELLARLADEVHALRVGADLGGVQRLADVVHELRLVHARHVRGASEDLGRGDALLFQAGEVPRVEGGGHRPRCDGPLRRLLDRPPARALHARLVEDLVDDVAGPVGVLLPEDRRRDLDQEGVQLACGHQQQHQEQQRKQQHGGAGHRDHDIAGMPACHQHHDHHSPAFHSAKVAASSSLVSPPTVFRMSYASAISCRHHQIPDTTQRQGEVHSV